jgi:hypothetical protein
VLLGAMLRGDWERFETRLKAGAACAAEAERSDAWPGAGEVEEAATAFRYERDLLSTEETEAWLERAGVSLEAWSDVLARDVLRTRWADRLPMLLNDSLSAPALDDELMAAEGICSGMFADFARALAERAAVAETADGTPDARAIAGQVAAARQACAVWLADLDPIDLERRLRHLAGVDARHAGATRAALTEAALSRHLDRHRLEWMRVDLERLSFSTVEGAREAAWCVREDGLTLSDVAIESRQPVQDVRTLLDDLDEALRAAVLSASLDDIVGPVEMGGRHDVAVVVGKAPATLADPLVRERAERSVIEALTKKAVLSHVTWVDTPIG